MASSTTMERQDLYLLNKKTNTTPIENDYKISNNVLGLGINGKVVQCFSIQSGEKYALKVQNIETNLDLNDKCMYLFYFIYL